MENAKATILLLAGFARFLALLLWGLFVGCLRLLTALRLALLGGAALENRPQFRTAQVHDQVCNMRRSTAMIYETAKNPFHLGVFHRCPRKPGNFECSDIVGRMVASK